MNRGNNMIVAFIQARLGGSTRLGKPKIIQEIVKGKTVVELVYDRVKQSKLINEVFCVIPNNEMELEILLTKLKIKYLTGEPNDVLKRFYDCNEIVQADHIVRITADNPLIDPIVIDEVISKHLEENNDFTTNAFLERETYPDGYDVAVVKKDVLKDVYIKAMGKHREHVLTYIQEYEKDYKIGILNCNPYLPYLRLTLDYIEDLWVIENVYQKLYKKNKYFGFQEVYDLWLKEPQIFNLNAKHVRNEGYYKENKTIEVTE